MHHVGQCYPHHPKCLPDHLLFFHLPGKPSLQSMSRSPHPDPFLVQPTEPHTQSFILLHGLGPNGEEFGVRLLQKGTASNGEKLTDIFPGARFIFPPPKSDDPRHLAAPSSTSGCHCVVRRPVVQRNMTDWRTRPTICSQFNGRGGLHTARTDNTGRTEPWLCYLCSAWILPWGYRDEWMASFPARPQKY
jgi:hypothetical protein